MLDESSALAWRDRLQQLWTQRIPLAAAMQVEVRALDSSGLALAAPLARNLNHVGTAFGGSLQALATLAGWGVTLVSAGAAGETTVVVAEARMSFIAPVSGELVATAAWPPRDTVADFRSALASRGRARLKVQAEIAGEHGGVAARFSGEFVARRAPPA